MVAYYVVGLCSAPLGLSIEALEQMLRMAKARLESMAPRKEAQVKESSLTCHSQRDAEDDGIYI